MSIEAMAIEFVAATKKRAQARTHLSTLRRKWLDETGEFFDKDESRGGEEEPYEEMMAAIKGREDANTDYRRAKSRLFRACAPGVAAVPEPLAWEATTVCYTRFVTDSRYRKFSPAVQKWYRPICPKCGPAGVGVAHKPHVGDMLCKGDYCTAGVTPTAIHHPGTSCRKQNPAGQCGCPSGQCVRASGVNAPDGAKHG